MCHLEPKIFTKNWDSKAPSVGTFLAFLETIRPKDHMLVFVFGIKLFLLFKIESWNFQRLFEKQFRETSKNFNHSAHLDNFYSHLFYWLSDLVESLWGFTEFIFEQMLTISTFAVLIFSEGFAQRFGERLFANKINPKKEGFQCSLTHIFQHFPTYFCFTPLSYHYFLFMFSQLSRICDFHC